MTMPAGKYWIGDLCYVMHKEWDEVCEIIFNTDHPAGVRDGEFTLKDGRRFALHSTCFGDGCYPTNSGAMLGVDAGCIGCILVDDINKECSDNDMGLGNIVDMTEDFETSGGRWVTENWDGVIRFGKYEVRTGYEEDEDE